MLDVFADLIAEVLIRLVGEPAIEWLNRKFGRLASFVLAIAIAGGILGALTAGILVAFSLVRNFSLTLCAACTGVGVVLGALTALLLYAVFGSSLSHFANDEPQLGQHRSRRLSSTHENPRR